jgi:hypothetical protein
MGSRRYGARFGTAVANVGDLNMDGYEGKKWSYKVWSPRLYHCHLCISHYILTVQCLSLTMFTHISALDYIYIYGEKYKALRKPHSLPFYLYLYEWHWHRSIIFTVWLQTFCKNVNGNKLIMMMVCSIIDSYKSFDNKF